MAGVELPLAGQAQWFDGRVAQAQAVRWCLDAEGLSLWSLEQESEHRVGQRLTGPFARAALRMRPSLGLASVPVDLPDGSCLWLPAGMNLAWDALGHRPSLVDRLMRSSLAVLAAVLLIVSLSVWFEREGASQLVRIALPWLPRGIDVRLGDAVEAQIEATWLRPSELAEPRQQALQMRFAALLAATPGIGEPAPRLSFRRSAGTAAGQGAGFNAFALPNGRIVLLDGLAEALSDEELVAVLAHELSHVQRRHSMAALLRAVGLVAVGGAVLGDFSAVAAQMVASLKVLQHSRDAEREADHDASLALRRLGLPAAHLVSVWQKFADKAGTAGGASSADWLSTHPSTEERLQRARALASEEAEGQGGAAAVVGP